MSYPRKLPFLSVLSDRVEWKTDDEDEVDGSTLDRHDRHMYTRVYICLIIPLLAE
jgi:hypothetical protein